MATGISAALNYLVTFVATKSYYNLETTLSLPGITLFNCVIITGGLILMYNILPETENRTLEDIELHFSNNSKKINDRYIPKMKSKRKPAQNECDSSEIPTRPVSTSDCINVTTNYRQNGCDNRGFIVNEM